MTFVAFWKRFYFYVARAIQLGNIPPSSVGFALAQILQHSIPVIQKQGGKMRTTVNEIMTREVIWASSEAYLRDAFEMMRSQGVRHIPILDPGTKQVVGMLSDGDVFLYYHKNGSKEQPDRLALVAEAMSQKVVYCYPTSDLNNVAATLISAKINSIPVLDQNDHKIVGIVTMTDFLDQLNFTMHSEENRMGNLNYIRRSPNDYEDRILSGLF